MERRIGKAWINAFLGALAFLSPAGDVAAESVLVTAEILELGRPEGGWPWRYQGGDDFSWADPGLDDSSWQVVESALGPRQVDWTGIGWFRLRLRLDPEVAGVPLAFSLHQGGACEVYLDGELVGGWGSVGAGPETERAFFTFAQMQPLALEVGREHVVAVRYSNWRRHDRTGDGPGFSWRLRDAAAAGADRDRRLLALSVEASLVAGAAAAFSILHLLLFLFFPQSTANLAYALFTAAVAGLYLSDSRAMFTSDPATALWWLRWVGTLGTLLPIFGLFFAVLSFRRQVPRYVLWLALIAAGGILWIWLQPGQPELRPVMVYSLLVFLEMLRVVALALWRRRPDVWLLVLGLSLYIGIGAAAPFLYWAHLRLAMSVAMLGLLTSVSAYLARGVARTRIEARELEVRRRLLEAENRRQTEELEAARALQLSLLPEHPPELDHLDVAFEMHTATEVGGDYYDYKVEADGRLVLALGDATGHGLDAGLMAVAAKSLFQAGGEGLTPAELLAWLSRGIGRLGLRRMRMSMLILRLDGRTLTCAAAGMPPPLHFRAADGLVVEVELNGPPLGALVGFTYRQAVLELAPGDAVLLTTDGLPELTDPDGELLGYERTQQLFAEAAQGRLRAGEMVRGLLDAAQLHAAGGERDDDLTLACLRCR